MGLEKVQHLAGEIRKNAPINLSA